MYKDKARFIKYQQKYRKENKDLLKKKAHLYYLEHQDKIEIKKKETHLLEPWKRIFTSINQRCNNLNCNDYEYYGGRGIKNRFKNADEIKVLYFRDKAYLMKKPSIDRIDNDGDYCIENCRFIKQGINSTEMNKRIKSKPVLQFDLKNNFIREWKSAAEIEQILGFLHGNISSVCCGKYKQAYNFIWKFKEK